MNKKKWDGIPAQLFDLKKKVFTQHYIKGWCHFLSSSKKKQKNINHEPLAAVDLIGEGVCVKSKLTDPGQSKDYTISPLNSANPNKDLSVTTVNWVVS